MYQELFVAADDFQIGVESILVCSIETIRLL